MDDLVRLKSASEQITDINREIAALCTQKGILIAEYSDQLSEIEAQLDALRETKASLAREMAE